MGIWDWLRNSSTHTWGRDKCPAASWLEQLEPRLLLSADSIGLDVTPCILDDPYESAIVIDVFPDDSSAFNGTLVVDEVEPLHRNSPFVPTESAPGDTTVEDTPAGRLSDGSVASESVCLVPLEAPIPETPPPAGADCEMPDNTVGEQSSTTEELVETLRAPHGPPAGISDDTVQTAGVSLVFWAMPGRNALTLRFADADGAFLELLDDNSDAVLGKWCTDRVRSVRIVGSDRADDTLTVDLSSSGPISCDISYWGGDGGYDSLIVVGAPSFSADYTATGSDAGFIELTNSSSTINISFYGLEPVTISGLADYTFVTSDPGVPVKQQWDRSGAAKLRSPIACRSGHV